MSKSLLILYHFFIVTQAIKAVGQDVMNLHDKLNDVYLNGPKDFSVELARLKEDQERSKLILEDTLETVENLSRGDLISLEDIIILFDWIDGSMVFKVLTWLFLPFFCVFTLTVGEWTAISRWPLLVVWISAFVSNDFLSR